MNTLQLHPIGTIEQDNDLQQIVLLPQYSNGLKGLQGFSHIQVIWWPNRSPDLTAQQVLTVEKPYVRGPEMLGVFATRSPFRPNPIAVSTAEVISIDPEAGTVSLCYIDAFPGSPVLDLKPYTPSIDRVESPAVPEWCQHWPKSCEESACFDWDAEFAFED